MENSNSSKFSSLNHRIIDNYKRLRRRSNIASCLFFVLFCLCCFLLYITLFHSTDYDDAMRQYDSQISELSAQREGILDGTIQPNTVNFDETLSDNLNNLKNYPSTDDNYEVKIKDTRTVMTINRNNTFVSDNANILNTETKRHIYNLNKQLAASTNGAQLMVVTVKSLDGESIESLANTIFNQLRIGSAEENNGILYLIALEDRKFRLEVGYGLEGSITDSVASDIIDDDDVVSLFEDKKYDEAVTQVTNNVFDLMNSKTALVDSEIARVKSSSNTAKLIHWLCIVGPIIVGILSVLLIVLLLISRRGLKGYYLDYKSKLSQSESYAKSTITHHELFYLYKSGIFLAFTLSGLHRAITRGKLLSRPGAKAQSLGRVLIGDTLYSSNGSILTTAFLMSNYNSSNWSSDSDSSGGGGSSWGSFGGGSSGGGGASGGW